LQLTPRRASFMFAFAFTFAFAAKASADDSFTAKTQLYIDNDHTTVVSPLVAITRDAWRGGTLNASYVADVVSSASIDVVSNATKHMDDFRSEITAGLTQKWKASTISGSYIYSVEHDYSSHNVNLGFAQDLLQRNTTLALGWTFSDNAVGRTGDQAFHRTLLVTGVGASWTQTITPATIAQLSYTFSYNSGYEASPYRFVPVQDMTDMTTLLKVPETEPDQRFRHAFVVGLNRHLFTDTSIQGDYRFYFDNWGVQSHTIQLRYFVNFKDVTLRLRERFYYQQGASFYKPHYEEVEPYMVTDRELSTFWSNLVGAKISWRLPWVSRALSLEVKGDFFYFGYIDFPLLSNRVGATVEAGLTVVY
jgi:hypothetical protein